MGEKDVLRIDPPASDVFWFFAFVSSLAIIVVADFVDLGHSMPSLAPWLYAVASAWAFLSSLQVKFVRLRLPRERSKSVPTVGLVIIALVAAFFSGRGWSTMPIEAIEQAGHREAEARMREFDLSSEMFRNIRSDFDYLTRNHRLDSVSGAAIQISGGEPPHELTVEVSQITRDPSGQPQASLLITGSVETNLIRSVRKIPIRRGALERFSAGGTYQFEPFVESESFDGYFLFALARRKIKLSSLDAKNSVIVGAGDFAQELGETPRPVLVD